VKQGAGGELKPGNRRLMATYGTVLGNTKKMCVGRKNTITSILGTHFTSY
jgi:hypothetical protein